VSGPTTQQLPPRSSSSSSSTARLVRVTSEQQQLQQQQQHPRDGRMSSSRLSRTACCAHLKHTSRHVGSLFPHDSHLLLCERRRQRHGLGRAARQPAHARDHGCWP
jgi:hypothetical protein